MTVPSTRMSNARTSSRGGETASTIALSSCAAAVDVRLPASNPAPIQCATIRSMKPPPLLLPCNELWWTDPALSSPPAVRPATNPAALDRRLLDRPSASGMVGGHETETRQRPALGCELSSVPASPSGRARPDLLEAIAKTGSISAAGRAAQDELPPRLAAGGGAERLVPIRPGGGRQGGSPWRRRTPDRPRRAGAEALPQHGAQDAQGTSPPTSRPSPPSPGRSSASPRRCARAARRCRSWPTPRISAPRAPQCRA